MPVIRGNDAITINGKRINYQGVAHLRDNVTPEDAAAKTKGNGMDELIVGFRGKDGKSERVIIWGDHLDFGFRDRESQPEVRINGQRGVLIHFDDEQNSVVEGTVNGIFTGVKNAFDAIETLAKNSIQGVALAGAASLVGGTIWVMVAKEAAVTAIKTAIMTFGPHIATTAGMLSLSAIGLVVLAGAVKGAFGALQNQPKMETITGLINDQPQGQSNAPTPPLIPPYRPDGTEGRPSANNAPAANNRPTANNRPAPAPRSTARTTAAPRATAQNVENLLDRLPTRPIKIKQQ